MCAYGGVRACACMIAMARTTLITSQTSSKLQQIVTAVLSPFPLPQVSAAAPARALPRRRGARRQKPSKLGTRSAESNAQQNEELACPLQ